MQKQIGLNNNRYYMCELTNGYSLSRLWKHSKASLNVLLCNVEGRTLEFHIFTLGIKEGS